MIPLSKPYVDQEIKDAVCQVLDSGRFILGNECEKFEKEFANYIGVKYAIAVSSGTAALFLLLKALGVGFGDQVLVPSLTAFPTIEPILQLGAKPVFLDIDDTFTMSIAHLEAILDNRKTYPRLKVILPVHLYGHPANMGAIEALGVKHGLMVVEDCCQAHGAMFDERKVGSIGIGGAFSFYPSKNLTVLGDGGMITTNEDGINEICRMLRDHGRKQKYQHEIAGFNMRFNEIQAAVGRIQLKHLDGFNAGRKIVARRYRQRLKELPIILPLDIVDRIYHLYVVQLKDDKERVRLISFLKDKAVETGIHYPIPCHVQFACHEYSFQRLTVTEEKVNRILSLPIYPGIKAEEVDYICDCIKEFYS